MREHPPRHRSWLRRGAVGAVLLAMLLAWALSRYQDHTGFVPTPLPVVQLFMRGRCGACHIIPGVAQATGRVGPSLCKTAQAYREGRITLQDIMDDIARPNARVHAGYLDEVMPNDYGEKFSPAELRTMAEYIAQLPCAGFPSPVPTE